METTRLKIGELARRMGLTVRTLHHYDDIGLLVPSERSAAGYRLYGPEDVRRLTHILLLRRLGLPLEGIRRSLEGEESTLGSALALHIERIEGEIELLRSLLQRLRSVSAGLGSTGETTIQELMEILEMMSMHERYMSPEQLEKLEKRREVVGEERIREAQEEWPRLIAEVRSEMEKGTDPADQRVQALARRWMALVEEFTGGDPAIAESVKRMYQGEPSLRQKTGLDPEIMRYVQAAARAGAS